MTADIDEPVITLPDGADLSDPFVRGRAERRVREEHGPTWIALWPLGVDPLDGVPARIPVIDTRAGCSRIALPERVTAASAARVAELGTQRGWGDLVEFTPSARRAVFAHLHPLTKQVRDAAASELGLDERPWEIELVTGDDIVVVLRRPSMASPEKRIEKWTEMARTLLPAESHQKWVVEDDPSTQRLYLRRVDDRLRETQAYDWSAPVDLHHIPFGIREDGSPLSLGLLEVNMLFGGTPGGGKSGGLTALLCGISRLENVALIGLDPKRVEQRPWRSRFTRIARDEDSATDVLERMVQEMERRYVWLEETGLKKFGPDQFNAGWPLLCLMIDELADLVSVGASLEEKRAEAERSTMIRRLIAKGRAAGIVIIAATQKPQSDVIPTALRDLIQLRVAFATTNSDMSDTILGKGMSLNGGVAERISARERGVCFVVSESSRVPARARAYWVPDEDVERIAKSTAHLRIELPWLTSGTEWERKPEPVPTPLEVIETEFSFTLDEDDAPLGEAAGAVAGPTAP